MAEQRLFLVLTKLVLFTGLAMWMYFAGVGLMFHYYKGAAFTLSDLSAARKNVNDVIGE
jgi:hypothetical protein